MRATRSSTVLQHRLVWLLWLALLLPAAQAAATWHAVSHGMSHAIAGETGEAGDAGDKRALHPTHCDLCLTAAAVTGAALPTEPRSLPHPAARHATPQAASSGVWFALPTRAYRSRAPPIAQH